MSLYHIILKLHREITIDKFILKDVAEIQRIPVQMCESWQGWRTG